MLRVEKKEAAAKKVQKFSHFHVDELRVEALNKHGECWNKFSV